MPAEPDVAELLRAAVDDVSPTPTFPDDVRRGGRRRLVRRRAAVAAAAVATGAVVATAVWTLQPPPTAQPPVGDPSIVEDPRRLMPDLEGLSYLEIEGTLESMGVLGRFEFRSVASDEVLEDHVISHEPAPGERMSVRFDWLMTLSSGGPAVPLSDVPPEAGDLLRNRMHDGEEVLVVETAAGTAYKTDALLVGPCAAVDLAYRTFLDSRYDDECY